MSNAANPFAMMMAQAQEMAKAMGVSAGSFSPDAMEKLWPTMSKDMMEQTFGKGFSKDGLDAKTRLLLTLAGLTMQGAQNETQIRMTVRHALEAGATAEEIKETIAQMTMFAGLPAMSRASEFAQEVLNDNKEADT